MCMQLLERLRPELERRLNIEPGDDAAWEEIIDGAAEGVERFKHLQHPDVWVRNPFDFAAQSKIVQLL